MNKKPNKQDQKNKRLKKRICIFTEQKIKNMLPVIIEDKIKH